MTRTPKLDRRSSTHPCTGGHVAAAILLAALALVPACGGASEQDGGERPGAPLNLVIVVLDTLRPDHLGCYGYERATSPNLDRFASEGVVFERALSVAPWTAPALVSMVTSVYPTVHGVNQHPNPPRMVESIPTLTELLAREGYATAAFTGGGYARGVYGLDKGFQTFEHQTHGPDGSRLPDQGPDRLKATVELSVDWLKERGDEPFFLLFHTYEPHAPYFPELEHLLAVQSGYDAEGERARLRDAAARWNAGEELSDEDGLTLVKHGYHCGFTEIDGVKDQQRLFEELTARGLCSTETFHPEVLPFILDLYDAEIHYADEQVQRVFDALEELGQAERTIVAVVSDHGEGFGAHGELGHGTNLHETVLRMVMLLRTPASIGLKGRVAEPVGMVDLMPTLLELMELPTDGLALQGQSLVSAARGAKRIEPVFSNTRAIKANRDRQQTVRTERWRYIREEMTSERWLYDLQADPGETENVVAQHPEVARRLEELLLAQRSRDRALQASFDGEATSVDMDASMRAELEGLGYIGDDE